jgi:hypothetical protein
VRVLAPGVPGLVLVVAALLVELLAGVRVDVLG